MLGMRKQKLRLRQIVSVDDERLNEVLEQLPSTWSILENAKVKFGISIKAAKFEFQSTSFQQLPTIKRIRKLESYLDRNGLVNTSRPRRMPHAIVNGSQYWWVKETFLARKVIIPTPVL